MWGFSNEENAVVNDDFRYQDLQQENAILKQELTDLYSHLMIIDDVTENTTDSKTKMSSAGRLIIYDKQKRDTEVLLMKEAQRQQIVLLEKELLFQQAHMKEQVTKAKTLQEKLNAANERIAALDLEAVNAIPYKMKLKELSASLQEQTSRMESLQKTNNELTSECLQLRNCERVLQAQLGACEARRDEWQSLVEPLNHRVEELESAYALTEEKLCESCERLREAHILHKKEEVRREAVEGELRHQERRAESQAKEIARLRDLVDKPNHRQSVVAELSSGAKMRQPKGVKQQADLDVYSGPRSDDEVEAFTPLTARGRASVGFGQRRAVSAFRSRPAHSSGSGSLSNGHGGAHNRQPSKDFLSSSGSSINLYQQLSAAESCRGRKAMTPSGRHQRGDSLAGDGDCLCGFFPSGL